MKIAHVINIVPKGINTPLEAEQAITMACMNTAKAQYKGDAQIELLAITFKDENVELNVPFKHLPVLDRSTNDWGKGFSKKLPFLKDVLNLTSQHTKADYLIYTNADICVVPAFYTTIEKYIQKGHDAIIINRRRVSSEFLKHPDMDIMFAETGKSHTGYDCFIFKTELLKKFILKDVCIGVPPACNDLFYNIFCFAEHPILFTEKQLTYHIGMELYKPWGEKSFEKANYAEMKKMFRELNPHIDITKFPGSELPFFKRHFKWFMNPTFSYPVMFMADLKQLGKKRKSRKKPEVKGFKQKFLEWVVRKANFKD